MIEGTWTGFYEYGDGYPLPFFGERVKLTCQFTANESEFNGITKEEPSKFSVNLEGKIEGFVDQEFISFNKIYPESPQIEEVNGELTNVLHKGELEVIHSGILDTKTNTMHGTWSIVQHAQIDLVEHDVSCFGIWLLKKD